MKQVFLFCRTDENGVKTIKQVYQERHKAQGESVVKVLVDNQEPNSKIVYTLEPYPVWEPTRTKKAAKSSSSANGNGRSKAGKTVDLAGAIEI